jgi:hypothetical protein
MKIVLILLGVVVTLLLLVLVVGAALPRNHVVSRHVVLHRPPAEVYETVRNFAVAPGWRPDLDRVEIISTGDNHVRFREHGKQGAVTYDLVEDRPRRKLSRGLPTRISGIRAPGHMRSRPLRTAPGWKSRKQETFQTFSSASCRASSSDTPGRSNDIS